MHTSPDKQKQFLVMLEGLKESFIDELPLRIDDIEQMCLTCEKPGSRDEKTQESLFRSVHSLKGTAGTYGIQILTTICHQLEDRLTEFSGNFTEKYLPYIDLMRDAINVLNDPVGLASIEGQLYTLRREMAHSDYLGMIVEGSKTNALMQQGILTSYPIEFVVVEDGFEALGRLLHEKFDLLMTGREVGALNGLALISALRTSDSINKNIKTVLISATTSLDTMPGCEPDQLIIKDTHLSQNLTKAIESLFRNLSV